MTNFNLRGVWVAMPTPWDKDRRVDEGLVRELVTRYKEAGLHGAYTTGTDGELHVLEFEELEKLTRSFARAAEDVGLPIQIGCGWLHTDGVIRRGKMAREHGVDLIQVSLPAWIPVDDFELLRFYGAIQTALPDTGYIHYNIARSGRMLTGNDYARILKVAPNLAGSKHTGSDVGALIDIIDATPSLAHFVVDNQIVVGSLYGSPGFYSFIANLSPSFALELWESCESGNWKTAARLSKRCHEFFRTWKSMCPEINSSSALAKIATRAGICSDMPLFIKEPYTSGSDRHVDTLRELIEDRFPELAGLEPADHDLEEA